MIHMLITYVGTYVGLIIIAITELEKIWKKSRSRLFLKYRDFGVDFD